MFTNDQIDNLRLCVKAKLSEKRFAHTLGVENCAHKLGQTFLPDKINDLRAAALLHDITKELTLPEHYELIKNSDYNVDEADLKIVPAIHSFSAKAYVQLYFHEFATEEILDAVYRHTLGDENMSVFDEIIFLSDYIENDRKQDSCRKTADYLWDNLKKAAEYDERIKTLHNSVIMAMKFTISYLSQNNLPISTKTDLAIKALVNLI